MISSHDPVTPPPRAAWGRVGWGHRRSQKLGGCGARCPDRPPPYPYRTDTSCVSEDAMLRHVDSECRLSWRSGGVGDSMWRGPTGGGRDERVGRSRLFWRRAAAKKGQQVLDRLVLLRAVTLKQLGEGEAGEKAVSRFLHNERVSDAELVASARSHVLAQVAGRRVLAIQDTSEINFSRQRRRKSKFGRGGHGADPGCFVHPVLGGDADRGVVLGLGDTPLWEGHVPAGPPRALP